MNRKECYEYIKSHEGTANLIKQAEGKNYTNCSTAVLENWVNSLKKEEEAVIAPSNADTPVVVKVEDKAVSAKMPKDSIERLLEVLINKKLILKIEADYILKG